MALYDLHFFDLSQISTDDPDGFSDNGGYQFEVGVNTVNITPGAVSQVVSVEDTNDNTFDDDAGLNQTLDGPATLNGISYVDDTIIEAEYRISVEDNLGNPYEIHFVSADDDAFNIVGFVVHGNVPPFGEDLLITSATDFPTGTYAYSTTSPACFGRTTRIATARGHIRATDLLVGDEVQLAHGGTARVALVLSSCTRSDDPDAVPIRIRKDALGPGLPKRDLILSPQHRVWIPGLGALVPARALTGLPRIGLARDKAREELIHVVLAHHDVVLAEGLPCESFWPGPVALNLLPPKARRHVQHIMGNAKPSAPMMPVQKARRLLLQTLIDT